MWEKNQRKMRPLRENHKENKRISMRERVKKKMLFLHQPIIVLLYKKALLNIIEFDPTLPSSITSLLQEYKDVFPKETLHGLPPIRGTEH